MIKLIINLGNESFLLQHKLNKIYFKLQEVLLNNKNRSKTSWAFQYY